MFKYLIEEALRLLYDLEYIKRSKRREQDFTRMRKISFQEKMIFIMKGIKCGLQSGLHEFFDSIQKEEETYSKQAFSKGRLRIKPEAFHEMFDIIAENFCMTAELKTYRGYRLTAIDGSRYNLPNSAELREKYGEQITSGSPQIQALASCLYDVLNHILMDVSINPCKSNEREIAENHILNLKRYRSERYKEIILLDRGYPSAKLMRLINDEGYYYIMRCSKEFLNAVSYVGNDSIVTHTFNSCEIPQTFRVIIISLPNGEKEYLITNITDLSFTVKDFSELYRMRWNIETKYNDLKNKLQIENFSGTSDIVIQQDFYATMFLSNLAQSIIYDNEEQIKALHNKEGNKYDYATNIAMTISTLRANIVEIFLCKSKRKQAQLFGKIANRLKYCVIPCNRQRDEKFPHAVKHKRNKFPMNKHYGCS